jgi:hypothetical protein
LSLNNNYLLKIQIFLLVIKQQILAQNCSLVIEQKLLTCH